MRRHYLVCRGSGLAPHHSSTRPPRAPLFPAHRAITQDPAARLHHKYIRTYTHSPALSKSITPLRLNVHTDPGPQRSANPGGERHSYIRQTISTWSRSHVESLLWGLMMSHSSHPLRQLYTLNIIIRHRYLQWSFSSDLSYFHSLISCGREGRALLPYESKKEERSERTTGINNDIKAQKKERKNQDERKEPQKWTLRFYWTENDPKQPRWLSYILDFRKSS